MDTVTATTNTGTDPLAQLRLLQLVSPALPIGAFAWSRGMESAVELGWIADAGSARAWIGGLLEHTVAALDLPVLLRVHRALARGDRDEAERWAEWVEATRESAELRDESRHVGASLAKLLRDLGIASEHDLAPPISSSHLACFALACVRSAIDERACARGYAFSWLEGQVGAAIKLVPLGQTDGQQLLFAEAGRIEGLVASAAALDDDEIGATAPGLAIASALHETQHTRLFRS